MSISNLRDFFIKKLKELDPDIDTSPGSNFRDIIINPLSELMSPYEAHQNRVLEVLTIKDPEALTEEELDAIGMNFLLERKPGSFHTGNVRIHYDTPLNITIPNGTRLRDTFTGIEYITVRSYTVTRQTLALNEAADGSFHTNNIEVRTVERIEGGSLGIGRKLDPTVISGPSPLYASVSSNITGGSGRETNTSFYRRIINSVKTSTLASEQVLTDSVIDYSSDIDDARVIGSNSPEMIRDLIAYNELQANTVENFEAVQRELDIKGHKAFWNNFLVEIVNNSDNPDIEFPDPSEWEDEFTDEQYRGLFKLDSAYYASQDEYQIITVPEFNRESFARFELNDGNHPSNEIQLSDTARLDGTSVILGITPDEDKTPRGIISIPDLTNIQSDLEDLVNSGASPEDFKEIIQDLSEVKDPRNYMNTAPVMHREIFQHIGIRVSTQMETNDPSPYGQVSYITVLRNNTLFIPQDGYGIAWRKQPDFITRLNYDDYEDESLRQGDIEKFKELFGDDPVEEDLIGDNKLKDNPDNEKYWFFNIYLVDNNALSEDTQMGVNKVFDSINGINQFMQKSKFWIEKDTAYDFELEISRQLGTKIRVKEANESDFTEVINKGATYPPFLPNSAETIATDTGVDSLLSSRGHFGIGVLETKGGEWRVNSVFVRSIVQSFPMHLFRFDMSNHTDKTGLFDVEYWGVGRDPNGSARTQAGIWNPNASSWELLGTHLSDINSPDLDSKKISSSLLSIPNYSDENGFMYIAASAANFNDIDHNLRSYYIRISDPQAGMRHLGNAIDVYCKATNQIVKTQNTQVIADNKITIQTPYIIDITSVNESNSGIGLEEGEYIIHNIKRGETFGNENEFLITFDPALSLNGSQITVEMLTWSAGSGLQGFLDSPENRYPATTIKAKAGPYVLVEIDYLEYSGPFGEDEAKTALKDWINNQNLREISRSGIISVLNDMGAYNVSLEMEINLKVYNTVFSYNRVFLENTPYKLGDLGWFYTNEEFLQGIERV